MEGLVLLAAKSLLIAGATLLLLKLMQRRSASDRSWVAHLGLLAILLLPVWALAVPALQVAGPAFLSAEVQADPIGAVAAPAAIDSNATEVGPAAGRFPEAAVSDGGSAVDWAFWAYAGPSFVLLLLTLIALGRLSILKSRANVLVDAHWLQALARAQHRMGFKNGTALLTSDELSSPISWGLMRPVILLNTSASMAHDEAEAIIAHELAHVASLDWAKLMLARVTVALFWFNPLVWLLAREAHQLREEAADDAVLAANIEDTDYANLLVGIARHECRGLLLGAHGVAPGKGSLTRRVRRVLDAALERAPGGWRWSSAAAFFAAGMTVPLAAIQFVTPSIASAARQERFVERPTAPLPRQDLALDTLPPESFAPDGLPAENFAPEAPALASLARTDPALAARLVGTADPVLSPSRPLSAREPVVGIAGARASADLGTSVNAAVAVALSHAGRAVATTHDRLDRTIGMRAVGATPEYLRSLREAGVTLRLSQDDLIGLAATGVTPGFVRDLSRSGLRNLTADDIHEARAIGVDGSYVRGMAAVGYRDLSMDQLTELRAVGVTPRDAARYRSASGKLPSIDMLVAAKTTGVHPEDIDPHHEE
jgi:beta-lactamase regulating signal transducer with metallopeptidase domain